MPSSYDSSTSARARHRRRSRSASHSSDAGSDQSTASPASTVVTSFDHLQAVRGVAIIASNEYPLPHLSRDKVRRRARAGDDEDDDEDGGLCFCTAPEAAERHEARANDETVRRCDDVSCLNFATYVECSAACRAGSYCRNQRLQHPERFPTLEPFKTEHKGYGVRTREHIAQLSIVGEYVGEIIDQKELARRLKTVPRHELNFYYLLLAPGVYIDARNKGSFTRFVNHSCEPNCKTEKWTVKGETRIAVIALRDIDVGEELTFDYQWKALGSRQIKCFCGSENCKGIIGTEGDTVQSAEAKAGYFRDPEKREVGKALEGRRVRVFLSPDDTTEYDVLLIKHYDEQQDQYEVEDLLEPAGYMTDEQDEDEEQEAGEKQFVQLKENGWQLYCPRGDAKQDSVFEIPKKRQLLGFSEPPSAAGSREPSPKPTGGDTTSLSSGDTPSPQAASNHLTSIGQESGFGRNLRGERQDRDSQPVSNKILMKGTPSKYDAAALSALFSRKRRGALVSLDMFLFLDGTGWALVELADNDLAAWFHRTMDHRPLDGKMLRVYLAGAKELDTFRYQKNKVQVMRRQAEEAKKDEDAAMEDSRAPYCFGRKLNWLVSEEEMKDLPVQQVLSASLEETMRVKYVKVILHIAKALRLDREDASSAIIALNRYFTFYAMPMDVEVFAATMLHLFLKAHARKVPWPAFVKAVYSAKYGSTAGERLPMDSPELAVLKRHLVKTEGELLEGLRYDLTGEDPYALLDLLTTGKSRKKLVSMTYGGAASSAQQLPSFLSSLPPPEVQKEAKHLVAEALPLPIWRQTPVECVILSVVYVSAAVSEALKPITTRFTAAIPDFLPQLDAQSNQQEARMLLDCSLAIIARLKDRWTRLEKQSKVAQQQKQASRSESDEFDLEQFTVSRDKKHVEISERIARTIKGWINVSASPNLPTSSSGSDSTSLSAGSSALPIAPAAVTAAPPAGSSSQRPERKSFITLKALGGSVPSLCSSTGPKDEASSSIAAVSVVPKKPSPSRIGVGAAGTNASSVGGGGVRLHTNEITHVESIRKRASLGVISDEVSLDLAGQHVYLQLWPYLEQEVFFTEERGINEACLRELSAAITLPSLLPDRFMKLHGIVFPAEKKQRETTDAVPVGNDKSSTAVDVETLDLLAATIDDEGNALPEGMDRLDHRKHYLAFEQPLHMFSGIFEARLSLPLQLRKKAIFDMLQSLTAVHDQGYVHRFVAPSHLLIFRHGVKLGGFHAMRKTSSIKPKDGEAAVVSTSSSAYEMSDGERKEHCYGAWLYVTAPEVLLGETKYTWRADVWSAGCVVLAILLDKVPLLQGQNVKVQLDLIFRLCGTPSSSWEGGSKLPLFNTFRPKHEYKMRLRKTLLEQRAKYPDFPEDAVELLEAMLQLDPAKRSPVKKLLEMSFFNDVRRRFEDSARSGEQAFDFGGLAPTFPVQKKKLVQHLLKSRAKKRRLSSSSSGYLAGSHRSSNGKESLRGRSSSGHHHRKRTASSAQDGSSSGAENSSSNGHRRSRGDERKVRSSSSSRRESAGRDEDVEMPDVSEYVPLPASFQLATAPASSTTDANGSRRPREKRAKLGWGMGLNSSQSSTQSTPGGSPTKASQ
ncbi:hypothetical protein BBJ28_00003292 [Nothophytophthora sp. Chile5]|nr:hypothetical protein BBJ28_00003292 [Nothophytophthora sp. Chile5]